MKNLYPLVLVVTFGLPFLAITDLFPLHRFGMFARIPETKGSIEFFEFQTKTKNGTWQKLKTGNDYMDQSYLPLLAERCFGSNDKQMVMGNKLAASLKDKPDSIRIAKSGLEKLSQHFTIFPK